MPGVLGACSGDDCALATGLPEGATGHNIGRVSALRAGLKQGELLILNPPVGVTDGMKVTSTSPIAVVNSPRPPRTQDPP